ncbi:cytochrome c [Pseudomonas sp. NCCP-436]|uniref:c-type cytochrome n=1 Tax=Pseudomonas sp. NCCP-436 TaxID=2842481 RepID=UPI001C7E5DDE|nr:cytochrome c [Pseudomonas sp. NCCP-436]
MALGRTAMAAELMIELDETPQVWTTEALLSHPQIRDIEIADDVSYKRSMRYRAVPARTLLEGLAPGDHLQVIALDGFAAELPASILLASEGARAWLAVEDTQYPWPPLAPGRPSAGPFYLVWSDPAASQISPEQWPYQVSRIRLQAPVAQRFPQLLPAPEAGVEIQAGYAAYQRHCMACHRLNAAGDATFGPDLNIPHNPTEYFSGDFLAQYIRNPQSLRRWPQGRMPAFTEAILPVEELNALLAYLQHMASHKVPVPQDMPHN